MSDTSADVKLAVLEERWKMVLEELKAAKESRKDQYEQLEEMRLSIQAMNNRVQSLEQSFASNKPTIEEFITIRHKVKAAGWIGKWLWVAVAFLIGNIVSLREHAATFIAWIQK